MADELSQTQALIEQHQTRRRLFRAPYAKLNARTKFLVRCLGYRICGYNVAPRDWHPENQPRRWIELGLEQMMRKRSAIVVLHVKATTAENIETFIAE